MPGPIQLGAEHERTVNAWANERFVKSGIQIKLAN
jgi:hypothetical protein